ncbi:response regulator transcription factor [Bacillus xiapuensis]|uniref:response regulator transcription factor n=1 Tax=Bacillus xiapuensis TaxID=2014075 RepID=UPI000C2306AB|nr:response regulator transcription factor [Bacillus xiapuensis]
MAMHGLVNKTILLIDDEVEILKLLEMVLRKEGFLHIRTAATGKEGLDLCRSCQPDVIVLDIMLPDMEGYEVCRQIREFSLVPIIFLSAKSDDIDKLLGLGIGGDDYVTKPFSPKEVAFRVKAQLRRSAYYPQQAAAKQDVLVIGDIEINQQTGEVKKGGKNVLLTAKEWKLLLFLAAHPNQIMSKAKICDAVWGEEYVGHDNTIMVHIRHLREKLESEPGKPQWILTVKGLGYKLNTRGH